MKKECLLAATCVVAGLLLTGTVTQAQVRAANAQTSASQDYAAPSDQDIEMLRKDLRSQKKQIIAANLKLTDKETEKFWPLYDRYTAELGKVNDTKYRLVKDFANSQNNMTDEQAETYVKGIVGVDRAVADLRLKYWSMFRNVTSARNTALFFRLDRRMTIMIDLQIASQLPLIQP